MSSEPKPRRVGGARDGAPSSTQSIAIQVFSRFSKIWNWHKLVQQVGDHDGVQIEWLDVFGQKIAPAVDIL